MDVVRGAKNEAEMDAAEFMRLQIRVEEQTLEDATAGVFEERFEFAEDFELIRDGEEETKVIDPQDQEDDDQETLEQAPEIPTLLSAVVQCLIENKDFVE